MRLSRKIAQQQALKPFVGEEVLPGPECESEEEMIEEIRVRGVSHLYPVGPAEWGARSMQLSIPGCVSMVWRLRVPTPRSCRVLGGNTNAPSIMIGEKCAALILEDAMAA